VTVAPTRAAFTEALAKGAYDAALVDLSPIASDAAGSIAALRASSPRANVVLITGQADALPDALLADRIELVRKPFELREVLAALAKEPATGA
jgi:DNA-binding NtrC family response regulator